MKPLDEILGNKTRVEILRTFFKYPGQFTGRHVARLCGLPQASVQRQLSVLATNNILDVHRIGTGRAFSLNGENFLYRKLRELFDKENELLPKILEQIGKAIKQSPYLQAGLVHASLYGSVATGKQTAGSDIDLFLVFSKSFDESLVRSGLEAADMELNKICGMHLHPYALGSDDLQKTSKRLIQEIQSAAITIFGRDLEDMLRNEAG